MKIPFLSTLKIQKILNLLINRVKFNNENI